MKVNVEPEKTTDVWRYRYTQDLHYRIYANRPFQTSTGEIILAGSPFNGSTAYKRVDCILSGDLELVADGYEIDSTEDSPDDPDARYSSYIFSNNIRLATRLLAFPVPQAAGSLTWDYLTLRRDARKRSRVTSGTYDQPTVEFLIQRALADLRFASILQAGHAFSSAPAVDPLNPIHVSVTDPKWAALEAGQGLIAGAGKVEMVGGLASVVSDVVAESSVIVPSMMSDTFFGRLFITDIAPGEGFNIRSSNAGDSGEVGWLITNPA